MSIQAGETRSADDDNVRRGDEDDLNGTATHENLIAAFSRDAQACRLLALYGQIAELEGYPDEARLFREVLESQQVFADGHLDFLRRVGDPLSGRSVGETALNLEAVIASSQEDLEKELPQMAATAHAEGFADIASWFETLVIAKRAHAKRAKSHLRGVASP